MANITLIADSDTIKMIRHLFTLVVLATVVDSIDHRTPWYQAIIGQVRRLGQYKLSPIGDHLDLIQYLALIFMSLSP